MPRSRAFRSTLEMPPRFSTATAMTSTLRVIQFSTSSFCRAASRLVGPSQIRSTPSSRAASSAPTRQLTKYGSPFAFGIMAMTGRFAADGARRGWRCALAPTEPSDRTSHTFVRRDDQRARHDRAAQDGHLAVLHRNLLLLSEPAQRSQARREDDRSRSSRRAACPSARRSAPTATPPDAIRFAAPTAPTSRAPCPTACRVRRRLMCPRERRP